MRKYLVLVLAIFAIGAVSTMKAQLDAGQEVVTNENIKKPFPVVWKVIHKALEEIGCRVEVEKNAEGDKGLFKGNIRTEFYIFSNGEDTTADVLERYGVTPTIRAGRWISGRIQYKFVLKELEDESTDIRLVCELSGFESYVTSKVHFWNSNGVLDKQMMDRIKEIAEKWKD
ncbi:MAG: hypothetical protein U0264_07275 [Candidatus Kapaibacterium sp.]